jgi:CspA family cold shock protein
MSENTESRMLGKVKWFNNKAGYGFITASEGDLKDKDIFVHYSKINVANPQYKYKVQCEYVEYELVKSQNEKHEFQATNVSGIKGGSIMCETRQLSRPSDSSEGLRPRVSRRPRQNLRPSQDRRRPSKTESVENNDGFVTVEKKKRTSKKPQVNGSSA